MLYSRIIKIIENTVVVLVYYFVPLSIVAVLILGYQNYFSLLTVQALLARWGLGLLIFLLFIRPISVITKRHLHATYRKLPDGINYLVRGRTQDPIWLYIKNLVVNTVYSLSLYFMRWRKQLGILTFRLIFLHRILLEFFQYQRGASFLITSKNLFVWTGVIGLFALLVGFLTSNKTSMKLLRRRWKPLQRIAYLAFLGACIHLFYFSHDRSYIILFGVFALLKIWERLPVKTKPVEEKKSEPVQRIPDTMTARVINHRHLTDQVYEYTIEIHQELSVIPGQRALFSLEDKEGKFNRAYSIADREIDEGKTLLTFTIKMVGGRGTSLLSTIKIGDSLQIKGIYGKFVLQDTPAPKVFIGTGVGVSALINMASHSDTKEKTLYYSAPYQKDLFYEDKIKKIHNLSYEIHITRENIKGYQYGRLELHKFTFVKDTEFYICGNPKVVDLIVQELVSLGYKNIFHEKF